MFPALSQAAYRRLGAIIPCGSVKVRFRVHDWIELNATINVRN